MKRKISVLLYILSIFSGCASNLFSKTTEDMLRELFPIDIAFAKNEWPFTSNRTPMNDKAEEEISQTKDLLKALKKLRTYVTPPVEIYKMTTIERKNIVQFCYEEQSQMAQDTIDYYNKLSYLAKCYKNICELDGCGLILETYAALILDNDISIPDEEALALMKKADWTQESVSQAILDDISAQQHIVESFKDEYNDILDKLIDEYSKYEHMEQKDIGYSINNEELEKIRAEYKTLVSDTDNVLKAIRQLLSYYQIPLQALAERTDIEYQNLHNFIYTEPHPAIREASECYDKLINVAKASQWGLFHPKDINRLFSTNAVHRSHENVVSLITKADWTQSKVSEAILYHIDTQQEIVKSFKDKYDSIFDEFLLNPYSIGRKKN